MIEEEVTLAVNVASTREVAPGIHQYKLVPQAGTAVHPAGPGSHIDIRTPSGEWRQYSLCNRPGEADGYVIAIKREDAGRGGSRSLIDHMRVGASVDIGLPKNYFALSSKATQSLLIAGGIGITPILSMARQLAAEGKPFRLIYCAQSREAAAYVCDIEEDDTLRPHATFHFDNDAQGLFDFDSLLETFVPGTHLYCCGPAAMMRTVRDMARHWPGSHLHFEDFGVHTADAGEGARTFQVILARHNTTIDIPTGKTILEVLRSRGYAVSSSCESGTCGACRTRVLSGTPDHRDFVLDEDETSEMMICVSRSKTPTLTLDI